MTFVFKGDSFENRIRIEGTLQAVSPTHIGTGETREEERKGRDGKKEKTDVAMIALDVNGYPYLPGSALKGIIRNYILQLLHGAFPHIAWEHEYQSSQFRDMKQDDQIEFMRNNASMLEQVFGTPFAEGKVEFWDAPAANKVTAPDQQLWKTKGWDEARQCYRVHSVAIDPTTGAAEKHKLYSFEVTPAGLEYQVNIVGQNLADEELGLLLFGLEGFNSKIVPLTIGAMSARGFGRMTLKPEKKIYRVTKEQLPMWVENTLLQNDLAGFAALPPLIGSAADALIQSCKKKFVDIIKRIGT
jgi:CRISPR/Cas system CSM-associated protein Csm3 (group 7 of RAMP superfamily)